ncbi:hypothetical protein CEXT_56821 [Caerostris extrusa]|uniref:Uncharacterized protein n=1 Tax=Caerostris extrusa TaxID=172846 RepID=A0AAV4TSL6_CAEEX|nr:hypothetical protein CEXT_56821 [Caerostris extrusa]
MNKVGSNPFEVVRDVLKRPKPLIAHRFTSRTHPIRRQKRRLNWNSFHERKEKVNVFGFAFLRMKATVFHFGPLQWPFCEHKEMESSFTIKALAPFTEYHIVPVMNTLGFYRVLSRSFFFFFFFLRTEWDTNSLRD